ncbi:hypothetical protein LCGC14_1545460 [marine sediment metagenome]|uniref:Uncharacterized protein n=1 Tax=marine sediment metagenome TaxID=412755 RepID=A0A0F9LSL7_9ZZZZ
MKLVVMREFVILKDGKFMVKRQLKTKDGNIEIVYRDMTKKIRQANKRLI